MCRPLCCLSSSGAKKFPERQCLGTRVYELEGGKYKIAKDKTVLRGDYHWETYAEIAEAAKDFGAGLVAVGAKQHANIGIFSANRAEVRGGARDFGAGA